MKNGSFTYGTTPEAVIRKALSECGHDPYPMELCGKEGELVRELVNQGIDSHLQAVTGKFTVNGNRLHCKVDHDGMVCLLRRLNESEDFDTASSIRGGILTTLEIEEI